MNPKETPVRVSIIRTIYAAIKPIKYRMDSVMQDFYANRIKLSLADHTTLLEFRSAASTVELLFEDYLEQAAECNVDTLYLPNEEFRLVLDLSKTAELAYRTPIAGSGMWTH
jgi:hypothetical protein